MTNQSVNISFSGASDSSSDIWATLEQEYQGNDDDASLTDLYSMMALGKVGTSSLEYLVKNCSYVSIAEDVVTVTLNIYVWPYDTSMEYDISCTEAEIDQGRVVSVTKSFDEVIDNSSYAILPYVFNGAAVPQTPYIAEDGSLLPYGDPLVENSLVTIGGDAFVVLRLDGTAEGFKHAVTISYPMETIISEDFQVNLADVVVTLTYTDSDGDLQSQQETMDIPPCVTQILEFCGASLTWVISAGLKGRNNSIEIYVDECKGDVLVIREVDEDGVTVGYPYV